MNLTTIDDDNDDVLVLNHRVAGKDILRVVRQTQNLIPSCKKRILLRGQWYTSGPMVQWPSNEVSCQRYHVCCTKWHRQVWRHARNKLWWNTLAYVYSVEYYCSIEQAIDVFAASQLWLCVMYFTAHNVILNIFNKVAWMVAVPCTELQVMIRPQ